MIINQIVAGGGTTPTPTEKYPLFSRVKDDTNTDIGVVAAHFTDKNNQKYAVVVLLNSAGYISFTNLGSANTSPATADVDRYNDLSVYTSKVSATESTTAWLNKLTSLTDPTTILTDVRAINFTIENTTYYGQCPNLPEMLEIIKNKPQIESVIGSTVLNYTYVYATSTVKGGTSSGIFGLNQSSTNGGTITRFSSSDSTAKNIVVVLEIPFN